MRLLPLSILGIALLATGCASHCTVTSDPPGATVVINGRAYGTTPATFGIRSSTFGAYQIRLEKEGYKPVQTLMAKEFFVGRFIVDLLFFWPAALINAAGPKRPPFTHHYTLDPLEGS